MSQRIDEFHKEVQRKIDMLPKLAVMANEDQMVNRFLKLNSEMKERVFSNQPIYGDQWRDYGQKFLSLFAWFSLMANRERTYSKGVEAELRIKKAEYMQSLKTADSKVTENRAEAEIEYGDITWESIKADHTYDLFTRLSDVCQAYYMFSQSSMSWERAERASTTNLQP